MPDKMTSLSDFLTMSEIASAYEIFKNDEQHFIKRATIEIIEPNIERINKALGQENEPEYLAYAMEYVFLNVEG